MGAADCWEGEINGLPPFYAPEFSPLAAVGFLANCPVSFAAGGTFTFGGLRVACGDLPRVRPMYAVAALIRGKERLTGAKPRRRKRGRIDMRGPLLDNFGDQLSRCRSQAQSEHVVPRGKISVRQARNGADDRQAVPGHRTPSIPGLLAPAREGSDQVMLGGVPQLLNAAHGMDAS